MWTALLKLWKLSHLYPGTLLSFFLSFCFWSDPNVASMLKENGASWMDSRSLLIHPLKQTVDFKSECFGNWAAGWSLASGPVFLYLPLFSLAVKQTMVQMAVYKAYRSIKAYWMNKTQLNVMWINRQQNRSVLVKASEGYRMDPDLWPNAEQYFTQGSMKISQQM